MILLRLYWEFFVVGCFSMGGGMATVPFLFDLADRTGWFTTADLASMIAISEATPAPSASTWPPTWATPRRGFPAASSPPWGW